MPPATQVLPLARLFCVNPLLAGRADLKPWSYVPRPRGGRHSAVASSTLPPPALPSPPTSGASVSRLYVLGYHVTALGGDLRDMPQTLCSRASSRAHTTRAAHPSVGRALLYALLHRQPTTLRQKLWFCPPENESYLARYEISRRPSYWAFVSVLHGREAW